MYVLLFLNQYFMNAELKDVIIIFDSMNTEESESIKLHNSLINPKGILNGVSRQVTILTTMLHPLATNEQYIDDWLTLPTSEELPVVILRDTNKKEIDRLINATIDWAKEIIENALKN